MASIEITFYIAFLSKHTKFLMDAYGLVHRRNIEFPIKEWNCALPQRNTIYERYV